MTMKHDHATLPPKGFTLIELIISIALFTIAIAVAAGGFVTALRTQRQVAALIAAQSNAGLALEQMAREMRTGYVFCTDPVSGGDPGTGGADSGCAAACTETGSGPGSVWTCDGKGTGNGYIDFYNDTSARVSYALANGELVRTDANGAQAITGSNVVIKYLTFIIFGNVEGDTWNPRVTIDMGVAPNSNDPVLANNVLDIETTVSSRNPDCKTTGGVTQC